jgi:hypothetical protein
MEWAQQMVDSQTWELLPPELIELQIGQIDLLRAMYPDEITVEEDAQEMMDNLMDDGPAFPTAPMVPIYLWNKVAMDIPSPRKLELGLYFPFFYNGDQEPEEPPKVNVRVIQPPWLNKSDTNQLMAGLPENEDLLGTIEHIKEAAAQQLQQTLNNANSATASNSATGPLVRVWFYFPSISTRSKRDDFIIHAPTYSLTGFLYAGKPGLLCVEGTSKDIDAYMKYIKTESWGDIPAHHKKVSERYRESTDVQRVFSDMSEITDTVGERRGHRVNRGDMKAIEDWLVERGLGEAFVRVLM